MINQIKFSVVIPTYNRPEKLAEALDSIAPQKTDDVEVIVINDASSEDYRSVVETRSATIDKYLTLPENSGVAHARNTAIKVAKGDWLCFLDDDDCFAPDFFKNISEFIAEKGLAEACFFWSLVENRKHASRSSVKYTTKLVTPTWFKKSDNKLHDAALCIGASFGLVIWNSPDVVFDSSYSVGEDSDLLFRLLRQGYHPYFMNEVGVIKNDYLKSTRLTGSGYAVYSERYIYEKLLEEHGEYLSRRKAFYPGFVAWSIACHYQNKKFQRGNALLPLLADHEFFDRIRLNMLLWLIRNIERGKLAFQRLTLIS